VRSVGFVLQGFREEVFEAAAEIAGKGKALAGVEDDDVIAVGGGLKFADAIEVNERGAVDAGEAGGGEASFERRKRFAEHEALLVGEVEHAVVVGGFDPDDVAVLEKHDATVGADGDAFGVGRSGGEERFEAGTEIPFSAGGDGIADAFERELKAGAVERFQKVVGGLGGEGFDGEALVGGDEDDGGSGIGEAPDDFESVATGHLHVEEDEFRLKILDRREGVVAVGSFADDFEGGVGGEQRAHAITRERLVVDDKDPQLGHGAFRGGNVPPRWNAEAAWKQFWGVRLLTDGDALEDEGERREASGCARLSRFELRGGGTAPPSEKRRLVGDELRELAALGAAEG